MLSFIGIGNAFNYKEGNCSAFYKKENKMILIDCGEDVFDKILDNNLLDGVDTLYILITHFHSDHVGSLGTLIFYADMINIKNINIIYPNIKELKNILHLFGVEECNYKVFAPESINDIKISCVRQKHDIIDAFGYLLNLDGKEVYYSGDTRIITNEVLKKLLNNEIDYFFQDTAISKNSYHISLEEIKELIPKEYRNKVYCMHLHSKQDLNEIKNSGFKLVKQYRKDDQDGNIKSS